jgi:uncharacterized protein with NRDE domain
MCTVTWRSSADGFEVFFNRDERKTRAPELAPRIEECAGVRFIAPRDGAAGGSWLGANDRGLGVALLNRYVPNTGPARSEFRSRGLLLLDLLDALQPTEVGERLAETELERYQPFSLLALDPHGRPRLFEWTGYKLEEASEAGAHMPLASSSFDQSLARVHRKQLFSDMLAAAGGEASEVMLSAFHHSHAGGPGPFSVCMHRDDAETRSYTRLTVGPREVEMRWRAGSPCSIAADQSFVLPRRQRVAADR